MKYLDYITGIINEALQSALTCERTQLLGVAQLAKRRRDDGKDIVWPVVYDGKDEAPDASFDDRFSLSSYHRSLSMNSQRLPGGYGDGLGRIKLQHKMGLVVWAHKDEVGMSADQLAIMLHMAFPDMVKPEQRPQQFYNVTFNITDVVLNSEQVFNEEFKNVDYFVGPEHALIKCNYTIESTVSKACFNTQCRPDGAA